MRPSKAHSGIPAMPPGVRLLRFWPPKESFRLVGYPGVVHDPLPLIKQTLARLGRKLRDPGSEPFSVEGLTHRLSLLGVLVEVDSKGRRRPRRSQPRNVPTSAQGKTLR